MQAASLLLSAIASSLQAAFAGSVVLRFLPCAEITELLRSKQYNVEAAINRPMRAKFFREFKAGADRNVGDLQDYFNLSHPVLSNLAFTQSPNCFALDES